MKTVDTLLANQLICFSSRLERLLTTLLLKYTEKSAGPKVNPIQSDASSSNKPSLSGCERGRHQVINCTLTGKQPGVSLGSQSLHSSAAEVGRVFLSLHRV